MDKLITFVKNERNTDIVHFDGVPLNGSLQGWHNNEVVIYFDYKKQEMLDDISKAIHNEYTVTHVEKGESTKDQFWICWTIKTDD
jgi:hypothetical protein